MIRIATAMPTGRADRECRDAYASARLDAHKAALAQLEWLDPANDLVRALRREVRDLERERSDANSLAAGQRAERSRR